MTTTTPIATTTKITINKRVKHNINFLTQLTEQHAGLAQNKNDKKKKMTATNK